MSPTKWPLEGNADDLGSFSMLSLDLVNRRHFELTLPLQRKADKRERLCCLHTREEGNLASDLRGPRGQP